MGLETKTSLSQLAMEATQLDKEKDYWVRALSQNKEFAVLPGDSVETESGYGTHCFTLSQSTSDQLIDVTHNMDKRLYVFLVSALWSLVYRYTDTANILVQMPVLSETDPGQRRNALLPLCMHYQNGMTFKALLMNVRKTFIDALVNQAYPLELLNEKLNGSAFEYREKANQLCVSIRGLHEQIALEDHNILGMRWDFEYVDCSLVCHIEYRQSTYTATFAEQLAQDFEFLLCELLACNDKSVDEIDFAKTASLGKFYQDFNRLNPQLEGPSSIWECFELQTEQTPQGIALICDGIEVTYQSLNERVNRLASYLFSAHDITTGSKVAILLDRTVDAVVSILAIIKAGAIYIPLDTKWPFARSEAIIAQAEIDLLITHSDFLYDFEDLDSPLFIYDVQFETLQDSRNNLVANTSGPNPAYIMFTSGSTGEPKGVLITHQGVVRLVKETQYVNLSSQTRILSTSSFAFDASTFELWGALLNGGTLVIEPQNKLLDFSFIESALVNYKINTLWLTSAWFNWLVDHNPKILSGLSQLLVGGDKLSPKHTSKVLEECPQIRIINGYGPTENTTFSLYHYVRVDEPDSVPLGKPISNSTAYVVNQNLKLMPKGAWGELLLGGIGLASGYLNNMEETQKRFVHANYFNVPQRLYRSGDRCRVRMDGLIEFQGRLDNQVKIRGFRIELEEIEKKLAQHASVSEVKLIVMGEGSEEKCLCAYLIPNADLNMEELKSDLVTQLPDYMIPQHFIKISRFPLTTNGKVDVSKLPSPHEQRAVSSKAVTETEKRLAKLWAEILEIDVKTIGPQDDFFDLGGHSLKATLLISNIQRELNATITLNDIFDSSSLNMLAKLIDSSAVTNNGTLVKANVQDDYACSPQQRQMFLLQQRQPEAITYNIPMAFVCDGVVDKKRLTAAVESLVDRHGALRTSFVYKDREIRQVVHPSVEVSIEFGQDHEHSHMDIVKRCVKPFSLSQAPLMNVHLIEVTETKSLLIFNVHHIIFDAISLSLLVDELNQLYAGKSLPACEFDYVDYAEWISSEWGQLEISASRDYWREKFAKKVVKIDLPLTGPRPAMQAFDGKTINFSIPTDELNMAKKLAGENGATLYMVLLACLNVWVQKLSGQQDVVIGTPVAGRTNYDVNKIIGMFVNTLALRFNPDKNMTCLNFLREVKQQMLDAFDNQLYPFELLVEDVVKERDTSRNPLFDIMFAWQNAKMSSLHMDGVALKPINIHTGTSKFDINISASEFDGKLYFSFEYNSILFSDSAAKRLVAHLVQTIHSFVIAPAQRLRDVNIFTPTQERDIFEGLGNSKFAPLHTRSVYQQVEYFASKFPEAIALQHKGSLISYKEFNARANQIGATILSVTQGKNEIVAIKMPRSAERIIAMTAVLKAGCAFLVIDLEMPASQASFMVADSNAKLLLEIVSGKWQITRLDRKSDISLLSEHVQTENLVCDINDDSLAYVIYTSGDSGNPRAVKISHRAFNNVLFGIEQAYEGGFKQGDKCLSLANSAFGVSIAEIMVPLFVGGQLVLTDTDESHDVQAITHIISEQGIRFCYLPLVILEQVVEQLKNKPTCLQKLLIGAASLSDSILEKVRAISSDIQVVNGYGWNETAIFSTFYNCSDHCIAGQIIPIGKPLANTRVFVVNEDMEVLPKGALGELCIAGAGLSETDIEGDKNRAILKRAAMDEYIEVFRTGDLVKWDNMDNLVHVGRIDDQYIGFGARIGHSKIEAVLCSHEGIKQAIVESRPHLKRDKQMLIAYYVAEDKIDANVLSKFCSEQLPGFVLPQLYVHLENPELLLSGKINPQALVNVEVTNGTTVVLPESDIERQIVELWSEVLGLPSEQISTESNFFDLGGNSRTVIELSHQVNKLFSQNIAVVDLFSLTTVKRLADHIDAKQQREVVLEDLSF